MSFPSKYSFPSKALVENTLIFMDHLDPKKICDRFESEYSKEIGDFNALGNKFRHV